LVLTHNTTEGINMMAWGVPLKAGDEVLLSEQEHIGNAGPWMHRANLEKIVIRTVAVGKNAEESLALVKKAITSKTKVIALPHVPCTNGQILPIKEICALAKTKNIITCIDGAHPTGMLQLNVKELGVDYYASCCHKWLMAAQGTGFLYINKDKLEKLQPKFYGAEGTSSFTTIGNKPNLLEKTGTSTGYANHPINKWNTAYNVNASFVLYHFENYQGNGQDGILGWYGYSSGNGWHGLVGSNTAMVEGEIAQIVFQFNTANGGGQMWKNGVKIGGRSGTTGTLGPANGGYSDIGISGPLGSGTSKVHQILFYNRELTDAEIAQNFNAVQHRIKSN
jgi:hypothetical protein